MIKPVVEFNGFRYTTSIKKLRKLKKRIRVIPGGSSAGKTFGILPILIDTAIKTPMLEISVVSESVPHLRKGALKDFLKIMKATGRYIDKNYNRTLLTYTFANGSYIEFFSVDNEERVRGPRRNILYMNEANNIRFDTYHQLAIRTSHEIWIDFNPSNEFWAHEELSEKDNDDVEWLTLTYKDNEALPESIVNELEKARTKAFYSPLLPINELFQEDNIKSAYWSNWWKVYGLGLLGALEGVIFSNWSKVKNIPNGAKLLGLGIDFGYTNDPTAIPAIYQFNNEYYIDEVEYKVGMNNNQIAKKLTKDGFVRSDKMVADCAEPKSIDEINSFGFYIKPSKKGKDSIMFGIEVLQQHHFNVTERSTNIIEELRKYCWDVDKNGKKLNKPIDDYNHAMDALRYIGIEVLPHKVVSRNSKTTDDILSRLNF
ncbi:terminase large subunit [Chishuiella sp.]|uniref:terminase large subunit n=1 Tax=Chishuiella sp. TaxID=1969467 RepID=UPI0028AD6927|nr:terminase large subunit [Chishuiella sp.]